MEYSPEQYTKFYIEQALFKLMSDYGYEKISVKEIAEKAGVGRATFYRYFKSKEDVIEYYFTSKTKEFLFEQRYYPRCREDYAKIVCDVFEKLKKNKDNFKLIKKAHLEYMYLDFLNRNFVETFRREFEKQSAYAPYIYAGMLFNVSMQWLDNDCADSIESLSQALINAIYFE